MQDYVVIDIETTGLNADVDEIIEIGAWKIRGGKVVSQFCTLVKPKMPLTNDIIALTGITQEMVDSAREIEVLLPKLSTWLEDLPLLGHNLPFDYDFLVCKGNRLGLDLTLGGLRKGIDTLALCRTYGHFTSNKLEAVAEALGIKITLAGYKDHRAPYDAYVTKLVYDYFASTNVNVSGIQDADLIYKKSSEFGQARRMPLLPLV